MKKIEEVISNFIDINNLRDNPHVLAFILYGSYVYNTNNTISDIDILIVIDGPNSYRAAKLIDGYHLDIHALTIKEIENHIVYERASGNQYIESVLRNGIFIINRDYTLEYLKSILTVNFRGLKRTVNPVYASMALSKVEDFLDNNINDDYNYYVTLEFLRKVVHVKLNASDIPELKVYKLYTNPELARDKYLVKLPPLDFRFLYLDALQEKNLKSRKEYLIKIFRILVGTKINDEDYIEKDIMDDSRIRKMLVSLNHLVITAEDNLIKDTPYKDALYYLTLNRIVGVTECAYGVLPNETMCLLEEAKSTSDEMMRIKMIEELFHIVDSKYNLDYDDFVLRL